MQLAYKKFGQGDAIIIIHGLYGSSDNWIQFARQLGETHKVYLPDLRNHGDSAHDPVMNLEEMASDLETFIYDHQLSKPIVAGHSLGGRTAMTLARKKPDLFRLLIVLDVAPKGYDIHGDQIDAQQHKKIIRALQDLNHQTIYQRSQAEDVIFQYLTSKKISQFLLKNLKRNKDGNYSWKINIDAIERNLDQLFIDVPEKQQSPDSINNLPALFVKGDNSNYLKETDLPSIQTLFPTARMEIIKNAGHWLHAEQPGQLLEIIKKFISSNTDHS